VAVLRILRFYPVIIIPPVHRTHSSFIYHRCSIIFVTKGSLNKTPVCLLVSHASTRINSDFWSCECSFSFLATHARRHSFGSYGGWVNLPVSYVACLKRSVQANRKECSELSLNGEYTCIYIQGGWEVTRH
jgi:hypothetical protein